MSEELTEAQKAEQQRIDRDNDLFRVTDDDFEGENDNDLANDFKSDKLEGFDGLDDKTDDDAADDKGGADDKSDDDGADDGTDDNKDNLFNEPENKDEAEELASLNKMLNKDFKSIEELKKFMADKDAADESEKQATEAEKAQQIIDYFGPLVDEAKTDNLTLMRKQLETVYMQNNRDINDQVVKDEIQEKLEDMEEKGQLDLRAQILRRELEDKQIGPAKAKLDEIKKAKEEQKAAEQKSFTDKAQETFSQIFHAENWYGMKVEKEDIQAAYKEVRSGEFIEQLQNDANAQAELAMLRRFKEKIFKKATGLNYSDGLKAVVDEFNANKDSDKGVSSAQHTRGTRGTGGRQTEQQGLIDAIVSNAPAEETA